MTVQRGGCGHLGSPLSLGPFSFKEANTDFTEWFKHKSDYKYKNTSLSSWPMEGAQWVVNIDGPTHFVKESRKSPWLKGALLSGRPNLNSSCVPALPLPPHGSVSGAPRGPGICRGGVDQWSGAGWVLALLCHRAVLPHFLPQFIICGSS